MADDYDKGTLSLVGIYEGRVVERDVDRQRVRVTVPGVIEPKSAWAYPAGSFGGGAPGIGSGGTPPLEASVYVFFIAGDPDNPRFFGGHWTQSEIPAEAQGRDAYTFATESFARVVTIRRARSFIGTPLPCARRPSDP